jgi:Tol biopolymer transport system component
MEGPANPSQIWEVPVSGGEPLKITNDLKHYGYVGLSADSLSLVTVERTEQSSLWNLDAGKDSSTARQVSTSVNAQEGREGLCHAPDGRIVYVSSETGSPEIWIMNADGSGQKQLTFDGAENTRPAVSPDGRYIAFTSRRQESVHIWRIDINGNNPKQLTSGSREYAPAFSPDGRSIVYYGLASGKWAIFKTGVEGGDAKQLTDLTTLFPSVSPDGKLVACLYKENPDYPDKIALIPFEGGAPEKVIDGSPLLVQPLRWRSNGQVLTYIVTQEGVSNIWGLPINGGPPRQLTNFTDGQIFDFDWSADGSRLVCARGQVTSDVILISNFR